jgi:hypothetical protein
MYEQGALASSRIPQERQPLRTGLIHLGRHIDAIPTVDRRNVRTVLRSQPESRLV